MNRNLKQLLIVGTCSLTLAGCCTMGRVTQWEYKVASAPSNVSPASQRVQEQFLNEMSKEGWILVTQQAGQFYLKRPKK